MTLPESGDRGSPGANAFSDILVVDDDEMNRDVLDRRLRRAGHRVVLSCDGPEALRRLGEGSFDLVVLDVMMPGMSGLEVLKTIRDTRGSHELPVIMATARGQSEDVVEALRLGANDYVTKPLDWPVALARIEGALLLKRLIDQARRLERELVMRNELLERANRKMKRDLDAAARIQRSLLPGTLAPIEGATIEWTVAPCDELAGDTLHIRRLDECHVSMGLIDVSGHGVPAALLAVTLARLLAGGDEDSILRGAGEPASPAEVLAALNRRFPMDRGTSQYFTMVYAVFDSRRRRLRCASAGHPGPILLRAGQLPRILPADGVAIGFDDSPEYRERILELSPGDRVIFHSDGVEEAISPSGELFGMARFIHTLLACSERPLTETLEQVRQTLQVWSEGPLRDDVSLLGLEIAPAAGSAANVGSGES